MLASVTPSAALLTMRDAILAFVAVVAGLPDELSIWAEAASNTSFIVEIASGKTLRVNTINHVHETGPTAADITWGDAVFVAWDASAAILLTQ